MTIHFAAARSPIATLVNPARRDRLISRAANDNGNPATQIELRTALKHFAEHGLGAASVARKNAEQAFFRGDRQSYLHWLGICRTLDRRMAKVLSARIEAGND
ncbi:MAG: hypothetical protein RL519_353 [Pseudomonadota bacterium]|jgi:hypothetical protein